MIMIAKRRIYDAVRKTFPKQYLAYDKAPRVDSGVLIRLGMETTGKIAAISIKVIKKEDIFSGVEIEDTHALVVRFCIDFSTIYKPKDMNAYKKVINESKENVNKQDLKGAELKRENLNEVTDWVEYTIEKRRDEIMEKVINRDAVSRQVEQSKRDFIQLEEEGITEIEDILTKIEKKEVGKGVVMMKGFVKFELQKYSKMTLENYIRKVYLKDKGYEKAMAVLEHDTMYVEVQQ